ncbi:hypothetical protein ACJX0J_027350 [Zea mays]
MGCFADDKLCVVYLYHRMANRTFIHLPIFPNFARSSYNRLVYNHLNRGHGEFSLFYFRQMQRKKNDDRGREAKLMKISVALFILDIIGLWWGGGASGIR